MHGYLRSSRTLKRYPVNSCRSQILRRSTRTVVSSYRS